jgi:glyoxylase-like metal-dependent hydrolase (beta-lactamase superfamily II)
MSSDPRTKSGTESSVGVPPAVVGASRPRLTLGDFELTILSDGTYPLDGGAFFGVVPKVMWSKRAVADERNFVVAGLNSLLIRTGKQNILVETGIGNKLSDKMIKIYGQPAKLIDSLAATRVAPDDIDIVINTHLHFDHCGWNTVRREDRVVATFPKAKYYVQEGELLHAHEQHIRDAVSYITDNYDPLVNSHQMELLRGDQEIVPGVSVRVFPGHTYHMQAVIVTSGGKTACYISDLIPTAAHIDLTWIMAFDLSPIDTINSRERYYDQALPAKWLTVFTHGADIPWAYIEKDAVGKLVARTVE